jgi:hypothetical protein
MDKFIKEYTLPRLNHEDIENPDKPLKRNKRKPVIKKSHQRKAQDQMAFLLSSSKYLKTK